MWRTGRPVAAGFRADLLLGPDALEERLGFPMQLVGVQPLRVERLDREQRLAAVHEPRTRHGRGGRAVEAFGGFVPAENRHSATISRTRRFPGKIGQMRPASRP